MLFKGLIIVFKYFRMLGFLRELEVPRMDSERSEVYFSMDSIWILGGLSVAVPTVVLIKNMIVSIDLMMFEK
ncbi:hypothetical protein BtBc_29725 (plasmid) [Bacillus thuringiensis]|nr:hypothetical protein BtBc_29725 [Bacillus thuringiensis]